MGPRPFLKKYISIYNDTCLRKPTHKYNLKRNAVRHPRTFAENSTHALKNCIVMRKCHLIIEMSLEFKQLLEQLVNFHHETTNNLKCQNGDASQNNGASTAYSINSCGLPQRQLKCPRYWPFFQHSTPIMRRVFPCHDTICVLAMQYIKLWSQEGETL